MKKTAVIIVDHGSRRAESNDLLLEVVEMFRAQSEFEIVEPAHMELAEPSIDTAFGRCAEQGAELVVVHPYFLGPGRHWNEDIPRMSATSAARCGVEFLVTEPLGLHALMADIMNERIARCLDLAQRSGGDAPPQLLD